MRKELINDNKTPLLEDTWEGIFSEATSYYEEHFAQTKDPFPCNRFNDYENNYKKLKSTQKSCTQPLIGRIENQDDNFILIGFDVLEHNTREFYKFKKTDVPFPYQIYDLVNVMIYKDELGKFTGYEIKPYIESGYFKRKEEDLRKSFELIQDCEEDDF